MQATRSKGPSGITGGEAGVAEDAFFFFFFFSLFETTEICFGSTKWKFLLGKSISRWEKMPLKGPTISC